MRQLVFIGGFPSGGTDLLKNILNGHSQCYFNGEMQFIYKLIKFDCIKNGIIKDHICLEKINNLLIKNDEWNNIENIKKINLNDYEFPLNIEDYLYDSFSFKKRIIWGNKTPQNTERISTLIELFPKAKFVIIIRDVRDVALSCKRKWGKNIYLTADRWNSRMGKAYGISKKNENKIYFVKYEDLLTETEVTIKLICDYLGISYQKQMIRPEINIKDILDGKRYYGQPIQRNNYNKWKTGFTSKEIEKIEKIASETMSLFDYTLKLHSKNYKLTRFVKSMYAVSEIINLFFVGNRYSDKNTIKDRIKNAHYEIKKRIK